MPSRMRGLAHGCVCALVFLSWAVPGGLGERRARVPAAARMSEDEADEALQRAAQSALGGREGTVLVLDAQTGRVRAVVNPRVAFEEATPPGSAIKPFTMLAALRAGTLDEGTRAFCRGHYEHEGFRIACSHPRYKSAFGPAQALANSCNYFFARTAESLDGDTFARTLREFGFGAQTRGGGDSESAGQLPRETPRVPEMLGDSEQLRVTPAQLATAYVALFNGGRLLVPQRAPAGGFAPRVRATLEVAPAHRSLILAGVRGAVAYGTASRAGLATLPALYAFGKTGTSTPQDGWRAQGWFVGFAADRSQGKGARPGSDDGAGLSASQGSSEDKAPPTRVRLAVLVFLRRSRGAEAAELARPVFEAYARTLARQDDPQLAAQSSDDGAADGSSSSSEISSSSSEVSSSSSKEAFASGAPDESGALVRVRLSRADATLSLPLDEYVFGVLAAEGSVETEPEALKVLAVIARTYALRNLRRHARDGYDLCDTTHCQRFMPVADESARPEFYELARRAVAETAGETLRDSRGRVAESYFSAACGGRTADISKLWGERPAPPYLRGVRDDFCTGAGPQTWTDVIPSAQLLRALRADERSDVGARLDSVRVLRRDETGRAELVALEGERRRTLRGWDFKIIVGRTLGWNVLKSSRFEVTRAGAAYVFRGTGFGHGLGLCQAGAHVMAARGASYRQILTQYFPGTSVGGAGLRNADSSRLPNADSFRLRNAEFGLRDDETVAGLQPRFVNASFEASDEVVEPTVLYSSLRNPHYEIEASALRAAPPSTRNPQSAIRNHLASEHFRVSYPARVSRREVESALGTLEAAHADLSRRLENASVGGGLPVVEVFIHETTGDFVGATGQPAWVAASTEGRRIELQPLEVLRRRGVVAATLRHEFVHAALEALGHGHAPRWLVEGLAIYAAGEGPQLARNAPRQQRVPPDELERLLARPGSPQEMRALYAAAYREVSELIRREGEASVWRRATQ
ncbi:MAG TPA: SpoIID/LytB domain-containing protein [Pyrinomonadaceae bacterium]|nr:SpoIID/LytB domain-containing protein [Pyrinomonadaceae bacterium]